MNVATSAPQAQQPGAPAAPQGSLLAALEWPGDVRDLPGRGPGWPWLVLALALALAAGTWFRRARVRVRVAAAAAAPARPAPTAMARLLALSPPAPEAPCGPFYAELKEVLRVHAAERFALPAGARTSEELQAALVPDARLAAALLACDQVLFARATPRADDHRQAHASARAWIAASSAEGA